MDSRLCIFDLDGTLADSLESIAYCANRAIGAYGFMPHETKRYQTFAGDGAKELLKRALKHAGDTELTFLPQVMETYREVFQKHCMYHVVPYDGIGQLLNELKGRQYKTAVLSNKPHERAVDVVHALFGPNLFHVIQGQCEERERKPSPEGAWFVAKQAGVNPKQCIYLGDTDTDMRTGKSAGMFTVGVTWGFRDREELEASGADAIINHPMELFDVIGN